MIRWTNSAIGVNASSVVLPSICVNSDWKRLPFQGFYDWVAVILQFHEILDPVFFLVILYRAFCEFCSVGIIRLIENSKVLDVMVGVCRPSTRTSEVIVGKGTVNNLLLGKIEEFPFQDIRALDYCQSCKGVTRTTLFLVLHWSHFLGCLPVDWHLFKLPFAESILIWWNDFDVFRLMFHILGLIGSLKSQKHLFELILGIYNESVLTHLERILPVGIVVKNLFSVVLYHLLFVLINFRILMLIEGWYQCRVSCKSHTIIVLNF